MSRLPTCSRRWAASLALAGLLLIALPTAADRSPAPLRRLALVAGANNGGSDRIRLRYAHSDARAMARVLRQLGGVLPGDLKLMLEPDQRGLLGGLQQLRGRLAEARSKGRRVELVFYYSGHSNEQGLLLRGETLPYGQLRRVLGGLPADIRVAVLDSCASGAMTRGKGGQRRAPFLVDKSTNVRGHAYLTSASATETAQESDRVGGSFFTHFLVSGLRGAADVNRDGRVTLNEAYQHAFNATLARTESTQSGPQHPNYDMQLAGSGDLVMTDLRGTSALLVLAPELSGRLFIRDSQGRLVVEIGKGAGRSMSLGLEPGRYQLTLEQGDRRRRGMVTLADKRKTLVRPGELGITVALETTRGRGDRPLDAELLRLAGPELVKPAEMTFLPGIRGNAGMTGPVVNYFAFHWLFYRGDILRGFEFGMVGAMRALDAKGMQLSGGFNHVSRRMDGWQLSVGGNTVFDRARGWQTSAGFNWADTLTGLQLTAGFNWATSEMDGAQISAGVNGVQGPMSGLQLTSGLNLATGPSTGAQISAGVNVATERLRGLQLAGVNVSTGDTSGMQLSAVNVASGKFSGLQLSAVNYGHKVSGVQLGVVNIAAEGDGLVPIGLLNIVGNGILEASVWSEGTSLFNVGLKLGSRHFYGLLGFGLHPLPDPEDRRYSLIYGLGGRVDLGRLWVDIDAVFHDLHANYEWGDGLDLMVKLRPALGVRVARFFHVFAGPTLEFMASKVRDDMGLAATLWEHDTDGGAHLRLGIGFIAGIQLAPRWGRLN